MVVTRRQVRIRTSRVFDFLRHSPARISSLRGGTRSGKTYNALCYWVWRLGNEQGKTLTITRQTMPALRASAMRDFFEILDRAEVYDVNLHNKTSNEYHLNGNLVEFIGLNESMRVRGRKRDYLFLNEANECDIEAFRQLAFRTADKIILDYNPSEAFSWIYDDVETRDDCDLLVTNYLDNPFLEDSLINEIERLQDADEEYWKVYGLGEIARGNTRVFTHWRSISDSEYPYNKGEAVYGLDFGYNNPTALVETRLYDNALYWREMLYQTKLTTADLVEKLKLFPELKARKIIADSAEPKTIKEIALAGFRIEGAEKGPDSIITTINFVKSKPLYILDSGVNIIREIKRYSFKTDKQGKVTDEVVPFENHAMDAGRYGSRSFAIPPCDRYSESDSQTWGGKSY